MTIRLRGTWLLFVATVALTAVAPSTAHAELREAAERLAEAWRGVGASVVVDKTRFLAEESDDRRPIVVVLPELPDGECTTVVLLGARGLGFHVRLGGASARTVLEDGEGKRIPSVAGAVAIERCGEAPVRRLIVASDSGRGAFETIAARSSKSLPPLRTVLPERSGGMMLPALEPGPLPLLPPPERRADVAETRAKRDGAAVAARQTLQAGADGAGAGEDTLTPGCHSMQLFAPDPRTARPPRRGKPDLDAEVRDASDRLLARDRTDAPDAQLVICVGEPTHVTVAFAGSPPGAPVLVSHEAWALPAHLPDAWGTDARGRMAHVLMARHVTSLPSEPAQLGQGGYGITPVPLALQPGACYLAIVAPVKETARSVGLRVHIGAIDAADDRGVDQDGAAVGFCAGQRTTALAEVEARGTPLLGWGFALYRLQSGVWESDR